MLRLRAIPQVTNCHLVFQTIACAEKRNQCLIICNRGIVHRSPLQRVLCFHLVFFCYAFALQFGSPHPDNALFLYRPAEQVVHPGYITLQGSLVLTYPSRHIIAYSNDVLIGRLIFTVISFSLSLSLSLSLFFLFSLSLSLSLSLFLSLLSVL